MEMIETKVISIETIKPSSPTPKSLQIHRLSLLDQLAPPIFSHLVYFYSSNPNRLKKSLPEVLSRFYPLAGRLVSNRHVDCNDAGVPFTEVEANCDLSQSLTNRDPKNLSKFTPRKLDEVQGLCMAAQATHFRCGGLALWISISHKIADGLSFASFVNAWSAAASGRCGAALPAPKFDAAAYFPPRDELSGFKRTTGTTKEEIVSRVFTFPASKIAALRERYSGGGGFRPSRVEALSAFIWTHFTDPEPDPGKTHALCQNVNLRPRADPPLSESHFGNMSGISAATPAADDGGFDVARKVRAAVKAVEGAYVAELRKGEKHLRFMKEMMARAGRGELVRFSFASLCGHPLYGADFGSGPPVWVGHGGFPFENVVIFMDAKSGGGIDALIHFTKQDMQSFQTHFEKHVLKSNL